MVRKTREHTVLALIVGLYIRTGRPVASGQVANCPDVLLSPASIRTVMSRLEERGLIIRAHASAGGVPTDRGLRAALDQDLPKRRVSPRARAEIERRITALGHDFIDDLSWLASLAAELTSNAGVAVRPMEDEPTLQGLSLIRLGADLALAIVVGDDGTLTRRAIRIPHTRGDRWIGELGSRANERYGRRRLDDIRRELTAASASLGWTGDELAVLQQAFDRSETAEVTVAGTDKLLESEAFRELDRLRDAVGVLENRSGLADEWRRTLKTSRGGPCVVFGCESELTAAGDLGMVATLIHRSGRTVGAVGVVGPKRMDYPRIVPVVDYIGRAVTRRLDEPGAMNA